MKTSQSACLESREVVDFDNGADVSYENSLLYPCVYFLHYRHQICVIFSFILQWLQIDETYTYRDRPFCFHFQNRLPHLRMCHSDYLPFQFPRKYKFYRHERPH